MNTRWFLPASIVAFIAFVAALTVYLSSGDVDRRQDPAAPVSFGQDTGEWTGPKGGALSLREQFEQLRGVRENIAAPRRSTKSDPRGRRRRPIQLRQWGDGLATWLDDAVVRIRSNLVDSPTGRLVAGLAALQAHDYVSSIERFDAALAKSPEFAAALAAKAEALVALGRFAKAADTYAALVGVAPRDATARYNYGVVLYRLSRFAEATEQYRRLVQIQPDHARGQYNLATLAQRAGHLAEAREAWQAFTELEPNVAGAWYNLGILWMDYEQPLDAAFCFKRVCELLPSDADAWLNLGIAYAASDHLEWALDAMETADVLAPCDATILSYLAMAHEAIASGGGRDAGQHSRIAARLTEEAASLSAESTAVHGRLADSSELDE